MSASVFISALDPPFDLRGGGGVTMTAPQISAPHPTLPNHFPQPQEKISHKNLKQSAHDNRIN